MTKPTPTPWTYESAETRNIRDSEGGLIAQLGHLRGRFGAKGRRPDGEVVANAALICRAVNNHERLLEALEALTVACEEDYTSPHTEGTSGVADNVSVASSHDGDSALTFGDIRRARAALWAAREGE